MLAIQSLSYQYPKAPKKALDALSLSVDSGEILGLLGPNGAGKTTLVSALVGLVTPQSGSITLQGQTVFLGNSDIAIVPQDYAFYTQLTSLENLNYFAGILRSDKHAVATTLRRCKLERIKNKRAKTLSGGEKRRLNLAITLLQEPKLLILDEPTANVDPESRQDILRLVKEMNQKGVTIIYTSHLLDEVQSLCTSLALIDEGQLKLHGPLSELLHNNQKSQLEVTVSSLDENTLAKLRSAYANTLTHDGSTLLFERVENSDKATEILKQLETLKLGIQNFQFARSTLESLYLNTTHSNRETSK